MSFVLCWGAWKLKTGTHFELSLKSAIHKGLGLGPQRRDSLDDY